MITKHRNRYGNEYWFEPVSDSVLKVCGDLSYWRFGGHEGQQEVDYADLSFADPSGGPFLAVGDRIEGRTVKRVFVDRNTVCLEMVDTVQG